MGNDEIAFCDECKYLEHILATDLNDKNDVIKEIIQLFAKFNQLFYKFGVCSVDMKKTLRRSLMHCFYGWDCGIYRISCVIFL